MIIVLKSENSITLILLFPLCYSASFNAANDDLCSQLDFVKSVVVIQETKLHQAAEYIAYQGAFICSVFVLVVVL